MRVRWTSSPANRTTPSSGMTSNWSKTIFAGDPEGRERRRRARTRADSSLGSKGLRR